MSNFQSSATSHFSLTCLESLLVPVFGVDPVSLLVQNSIPIVSHKILLLVLTIIGIIFISAGQEGVKTQCTTGA